MSVFATRRIGRHDRELSRSTTGKKERKKKENRNKNPLEDTCFCVIHVTDTIPQEMIFGN